VLDAPAAVLLAHCCYGRLLLMVRQVALARPQLLLFAERHIAPVPCPLR
jgi:hypothetical protein